MSWIQENKPAALTIGVGAVLTLGLVGLGFSFGSSADEAAQAHQSSLSAIKSLEQSPTTPEPAKVKELAASVEAYALRVDGLKKRLSQFGVEEIEPMTPEAFNNQLKQTVESFRAAATAKDVLVPEEFYMGFEEYRDKLPKSEASGYLNYELSATNWLFNELLKDGMQRVISVVRKPITQETNQPPAPTNARPKPGAAPEPPKVMVRMPIEIVVEARKESWAKVLTAIASSEAEHFMIIRGMRIVNEKTVGPAAADISFDDPKDASGDDGGGNDGGFDFILPEAEEPLEEPVDGEESEETEEEEAAEIPGKASGDEIVKPVLGTENVFIALQLEIVHFLPDVKIPGAPAPEPATKEPAPAN